MSSNLMANMLKELEKKKKAYLWLKGAHLLEKAATFSYEKAETAGLMKSVGYCYNRASQQARNLAVFRERRKAAIKAYEKASESSEKFAEKKDGESDECRMLAKYSAAWLASNPSERKKIFCDCLNYGKKSAAAYEEANNKSGYGRVYITSLRCLFEMLYIASDSQEMAKIAQDGIEYADKAIEALTKPECKECLLEAYSLASLQGWYAANVSEDADKSEQLAKRSLAFSEKALQLSASVHDPYLTAISNWAAAIAVLFFTGNAQSSFEYAKKMKKQGQKAKDNFLVGVAHYVLTQVTDWMAVREADNNKQKEWRKQEIEFAKAAIRCLLPLSQDFFVAQAYHFNAESLAFLARSSDSKSTAKRKMLENAVMIGRTGLKNANRAGSPDATGVMLHALSKTLHFQSNFEPERKAKAALLEEALVHRQHYIEIVKKAFPSNDWLVGVGQSYAGLIKRDLAELEINTDNQKARLESAMSDLREGILQCHRATAQLPIPTRFVAVGGFEEGLADVFCRLYRLRKDDALLYDLVEVNQNAVDDFRKINAPNRVAECYWRIAVGQDLLDEHSKASDSFKSAFREYESAAKLIPDFGPFYLDYAAYMRAWSDIEKAAYAHEHEQYSDAVGYYQNVSSILERTKLWSFFAPNFRAWSLLEHGEDLSRKEKSRESLSAFRKAAELFRRARRVFEKEIDRIKSLDEKQKAIELSKACVRRADYCSARMWLEAAKIDDRNGKHVESANKYDFAASILEKMLEKSENDAERKETAQFAYMVRAWHKMKMADAQASAKLYSEASRLFLKAKEQNLEDRQTLVASGNIAICKALEHGTLFEEKREKTEFSKAKKYLESASDFYLKAGFNNASAWTNATEVLLDAYNYLTHAETEDNPSVKSKILMLAEKCLEQSAKLYELAKYLGRRDEVIRIIKKVKEKRRFALSLGELLTTPEEASKTEAMPAPLPTVEEPVGLQKFEREVIQAKLATLKKEILAAEDFYVELHVANLGKAPAFLAKADNIMPEGFDSFGENETYFVEDHDLNMKGKRVDPAGSEKFKIGLRSLDKGLFEIKPRIFCVEETGHQVSCEPEPLTINVTETTMPNRVTTGYRELDLLLMGGIPNNFAVLLTSPPSDERAILIRSFLNSGAEKDEVTFYVAVDVRGIESMTPQLTRSSYLFICNPHADEIISDMPNVFKLKGIENLTDITIALTSAFRRLEPSRVKPRRFCLEIISDVLLQHHAVSTRRWLTALIPELRSHGFTTLAVLNPQMHPAQDVQAILDIFEGEICICEKQTRRGLEKFLAVRRLSNQRHLESELPLKGTASY